MEPRTKKLWSLFTGDVSLNWYTSLSYAYLVNNALHADENDFAITMKMHRLGIEQAANSALGGNLMLELLKEFVGRMTPNDRKVRTLNLVLA